MEKFLNRINGFGKYQKFMLFLIGLISIMRSFMGHSIVFTAAQHKLECKDKIRNIKVDNGCDIWSALKLNSSRFNGTYECSFSDEYYGNTIINEWNFQCDKIYLASFIHTALMLGALFSFIGGWFSDRYGRKLACLISCSCLNFIIVFSEILIQKFNFSINTQFLIYLVAQFFIGFLSNIFFIAGYILVIEITSNKYQTVVTVFNQYMYVSGMIALMTTSYVTRDWHIMNTILAIFTTTVLLLIILLLPESPRYLITKKEYEKCYRTLKRISQVNKRSDKMFTREEFFKHTELHANGSSLLPDENQIYFQEIQSLLSIKIRPKRGASILKNTSDINIKSQSNVEESEISEAEKNSVLFFLLNPRKNLYQTLLLCYVWIVLSMTYFGVSIGITSIGDNINPYVMYILSCIAELVGYSACFLGDKYSRKKCLMSFVTLAGIVCFFSTLIPNEIENEITWRSILIIISASIGKAFISAAYSSIYIYTIRMFPTNVRNTLFGICSSSGRIGSIIAPHINTLRFLVGRPVPYLIFSFNALIACLILRILPDPSKIIFE